MADQKLTLELDEATWSALGLVGEPEKVLTHLAHVAAAGIQQASEHRGKTDVSLRTERGSTDAGVAEARATIDESAKKLLEIARERADEVLRSERELADRAREAAADTAKRTEEERRRADELVAEQRAEADARAERQRRQRIADVDHAVASERGTTDGSLSGERKQADAVLMNQRDANQELVLSGLRLHSLADAAEEARREAEDRARELRAVADFREMFIGIVGHDLRTPLGSIITAAALLLRRGRLQPQDAEVTTRILRSGQRMGRMITQLLDLTRARLGGGIPIEPKPADLGQLCQNAVDEFEAPIQLSVEGDLTGVWDGDRLAEVLSNLTGNAVEYATKGTMVRLSARGQAAEVVIEVVNEGPAIPADLLPTLFEPFRRGTPRQKSAAGNLGLGLYIARQIALSHGGTLEARSAEGTTTFTLRLPRQAPAN